MLNAGGRGVVRLIQTLWDSGTVSSLDDAELLGRFLRRDATAEAAFAALVQRHAPMVFRVCLDVTGESQDAQDAAQATFLILSQKARSVRRHEAIANWLFGTARRVAARARRDSARRRRHEKQYAQAIAGRQADHEASDTCNRDWSELYQELARLPERYRVPIVLCDLEGLTHDQAALAIGCPQRTLETRLYRGRERLREKLVRRGLMPAAGFAKETFSAESRSVVIPTAWVDATTLAASQLASGRALAMVATAAVSFLIRGINRAMFFSRLRWACMFVAVSGLSLALSDQLARLTTGAGIETSTDKREKIDSSTHPSPVGPKPSAKGEIAANPPARGAEPERPGPITTPITVRGRAIDSEGNPVIGATIFLVSTRGTDAPLGTTTTDRDGLYIFHSARLPVSQEERDNFPQQGQFQVFGTAQGHGFAWHGMRTYLPRPRPANRNIASEDHTLYRGEPLVMDLRFPPVAVLTGRIVDEAGRPVPEATVRIIGCDYLDTKQKESHPNFREFWSIRALPPTSTVSKTDKDGHFRLEGLPKEAGLRISIRHPEYAGLFRYAATTARPTTEFDYPLHSIVPGEKRPPVQTGELNITLHSTRRIAVRTVYADTGQPAPKVRVSVSRGADGSSAGGTTDAVGKLELRLPPGEYDILADPIDGKADFIRTRSSFTVTDELAEQALEVHVNPGSNLILEVVDAKTGEGISGVTFMCEIDDRPRVRTTVQSRTGYIDHPRSDAKGRLRAVVAPGERIYALGQIPEAAGYGQKYLEKRVVLPARQTVTVRFELEK